MDIRFELNGESFVWDKRKADSNVRKHGIRFEEAAWVFMDPLLMVTDASRNDEARDAVIGLDGSGRLLFVVHVEMDGDAIRIISARRATFAEEKLYAQ
jgi:uncharacterized DUF497 family protein